MKAFIPAKARTPPNIRLSWQPPRSTTLGIASGNPRTIQQLVEARLRLNEANQKQARGHDDIAMLTHEAVELLTCRQAGKGRAQVSVRVTVEVTLALRDSKRIKY